MSDADEQAYALIEIDRDIERAARHMALEWPGIGDSWEDIQSEIVLKLLDDNYAIKIRDMESKPRRQVLHKIASQVASRMRDDYDYFNGNFKYSTKEIRAKLAAGALDTIILDNLGDQTEDGRRVELDDGEEVAVLNIETIDIKWAFSRLGESYQQTLIARYIDDVELDNADRMEVTRAVDALTNIMNRGFRKNQVKHAEDGGLGTRKILTIAQSVSRHDKEYEPEAEY